MKIHLNKGDDLFDRLTQGNKSPPEKPKKPPTEADELKLEILRERLKQAQNRRKTAENRSWLYIVVTLAVCLSQWLLLLAVMSA